MQYSTFTPGTGLEIENPENLLESRKYGWGTQMTFKPSPVGMRDDLSAWKMEGPGSWFHLPLGTSLPNSGITRLKSVTILFETINSVILHVHVYDGRWIIQQFDGQMLSGQYLESRNAADVDVTIPVYGSLTYPNTLSLKRPYEMFAGAGLSFYAHGLFVKEDQATGKFPPAILTVAGVGAQYLVDDLPLVTVTVQRKLGATSIVVGP
jgi:hypothetical protein